MIRMFAASCSALTCPTGVCSDQSTNTPNRKNFPGLYLRIWKHLICQFLKELLTCPQTAAKKMRRVLVYLVTCKLCRMLLPVTAAFTHYLHQTGGGGAYLLEVVGCVDDALLLAAEQSVDQLLDHTCLMMDDGQV